MKKTLMLLILFFTLGTFAQDQIIKKDGSELKVKITEISDTELKYQKEGMSVAFTINLSEILLVTFSNGERMTFQDMKAKEETTTAMLTAGTRIPLVMTETISSDRKGGRKVNVGELINLKVQADVTDIDGNILVIIQRSNGDVFLSRSLIEQLHKSLKPKSIDLLVNISVVFLATKVSVVFGIVTVLSCVGSTTVKVVS